MAAPTAPIAATITTKQLDRAEITLPALSAGAVTYTVEQAIVKKGIVGNYITSTLFPDLTGGLTQAAGSGLDGAATPILALDPGIRYKVRLRAVNTDGSTVGPAIDILLLTHSDSSVEGRMQAAFIDHDFHAHLRTGGFDSVVAVADSIYDIKDASGGVLARVKATSDPSGNLTVKEIIHGR